MREMNRRYARALRAKFVITLGDEFQVLLDDVTQLPSILFQIEQCFRDLPIRTGVGFGTLTTPVGEYAINVDGPALHRAREAVNLARRKRALGGVFNGFGDFDPILNGFARLAYNHRARMTARQLAVADLLRKGATQEQAARRLSITRQAVSEHVTSSGWSAYVEAEAGWIAALELAVRGGRGRR